MLYIHITFSSIDGYLGYFHISTTMKNVAINMGSADISFRVMTSFPLIYTQK